MCGSLFALDENFQVFFNFRHLFTDQRITPLPVLRILFVLIVVKHWCDHVKIAIFSNIFVKRNLFDKVGKELGLLL